MRVWKWRALPAITVLVTLAIGVVLIPSVRARIMRAAGWALVAQDRLERADVIVVPKWTGEAGALEAAELVRAGIASRVAVLVGPQAASTSELIRRGVIAPSEDWITGLMRTLGVSAVEQVPNRVNGTEAEGEILPEWCAQNRFAAVVVVTTSDHSRRVRRILHRTTKNYGVKIMIRPSRYSEFDPDRWWQTRDGIRTEVVEFQKLILDMVTHPIS
jgi:hypothetical protein